MLQFTPKEVTVNKRIAVDLSETVHNTTVR